MRNLFVYILLLGNFFALSVEKVYAIPLDLSPAKWIWFPSGRTLQNTFVLFRKEVQINQNIKSATGWILADSRYQLFVNGKRVQQGPAPSDPRWPEADPIDLTSYLHPGKNIIACQVCFFGTGDGTYVMGKPGFIFNLDVDSKQIISDESWLCFLAKSWEPGKYKRWFLRALQEEFDARIFPYGWDNTDFSTSPEWVPAVTVSSDGRYPSICNWSSEYQWEIFGSKANTGIFSRSIPMMNEIEIPVWKLAESMWIKWNRPPEDYFDMIIPGSYTIQKQEVCNLDPNGAYRIAPNEDKAALLTFELKEQGVGWPFFTIDAPAGTTIELLVHEAHKKGGPAIINSHFNAWTRFICKEGINRFETFDFESFRWLQLHIRNFNRPVTISGIGMRRRIYPWKVEPEITLSDDTLRKVFQANLNTLNNCAQETLVDGMARERQQYSGDGSHQLHPVFQAFGEEQLPLRFITTFGQGSSIEGYFMDSWPAWDRLARIIERQMQLTGWGPILDHSVGFCFDCYHYYMYTGDKEGIKKTYPNLVKFFNYLTSLKSNTDGLIPSEDLGMCSVYIDHEAYKKQRHKQLALNLYTAAMCEYALKPLCELFNDNENAAKVEHFGHTIKQACVAKFWSNEEQIFINNLPWLNEEKEKRYCDRSLATAILFHLCPGDQYKKSLETLIDCPKELGLSYPCNAIWRLWALASKQQIMPVLNDLRHKWGKMNSVWENNVIQEFWNAGYDDNSQWSHCAVAPLVMLYQGIAGIVPIEPGYGRYRILPQPGDLTYGKFDIQTHNGPVHFEFKGKKGNRELILTLPFNGKAELWLDAREKVNLPQLGNDVPNGLKKYDLANVQKVRLRLRFM